MSASGGAKVGGAIRRVRVVETQGDAILVHLEGDWGPGEWERVKPQFVATLARRVVGTIGQEAGPIDWHYITTGEWADDQR